MKKHSTKISTYLVLFGIAILISAGIVFSTKSINEQSNYVAPSHKLFVIEDDTGYTDHISGWPIRFYSYSTFLSVGTPVTTDGEIEWDKFVLDIMIVTVPVYIAILAATIKGKLKKPSK
jgi:hypothetical protein